MAYVNTAAYTTRSMARMSAEQPLLLDGEILDAETPAAGGVQQIVVRNGFRPVRRRRMSRDEQQFRELQGLYGWDDPGLGRFGIKSVVKAVQKVVAAPAKVVQAVVKGAETVAKDVTQVPQSVASAASRAAEAAVRGGAQVSQAFGNAVVAGGVQVGKAVVSGAKAVGSGTEAVGRGVARGVTSPKFFSEYLPMVATLGLSKYGPMAMNEAMKGLAMTGVFGKPQAQPDGAGGVSYTDANGNPITEDQYNKLMADYTAQGGGTSAGGDQYLDASGNVITEAEYNRQMALINQGSSAAAATATPTSTAAYDPSGRTQTAQQQAQQAQQAQMQQMQQSSGGGGGAYGDQVSSGADPYGMTESGGGSASDYGSDYVSEAGGSDSSSDSGSDGFGPAATMTEVDANESSSATNAEDYGYSYADNYDNEGIEGFSLKSIFSAKNIAKVQNVVAQATPIVGSVAGALVGGPAGLAIGGAAGQLVGGVLTKKEKSPDAPADAAGPGGATPVVAGATSVADASSDVPGQAPARGSSDGISKPLLIGGGLAAVALTGLIVYLAMRRPAAATGRKTNPRRRRR